MHSPLQTTALFHVGPVAITEPVIVTWVIMGVLVAFAFAVTRRLSLIPSKAQTILELFVGAIDGQIRGTMQVEPGPYRALLGTIFVFILLANWSSLIPGVEPPTAHLETDAAFAAIVFCATIFYGIRARGLSGYLSTFAEPTWVMIPLNIVEQITRTFSLIVRLFGNIMSGVFIGAIILSLAGLFVPIPFMALDLLTGAIQAYIFTILAMVFIGAAVAEQRQESPTGLKRGGDVISGTADVTSPPPRAILPDTAKRQQRRFPGLARLLASPKSVLRWRMLAAAAVIVILADGWHLWSLHSRNAVRYATTQVERGSIVRTVSAVGVVNPITAVPVSAHVSGVIQALHCDLNLRVKEGQLCAKIDPRPFQADVDQAKAALAQGQARLEKEKAALAQKEAIFERNQIQAKRRAGSRSALDKSRNAYEQARAQALADEAAVAERQAALRAAEINLGNTDIVSPVDGMVISRSAEVRQAVTAGSQAPLFQIASDLTRVRVDANVGEKDIGEVKLGDKVTFTVQSLLDHLFTGEVTQINQSPQPVENGITYHVVISAPNPDLLLNPGMAAAATVVVDRHDGILRVPDQARRYSPAGLANPNPAADGSTQLWVLRRGKPVAVSVGLGLDDGAYAEVVTGELQPADQLIVGERKDTGAAIAEPHQESPTTPNRK